MHETVIATKQNAHLGIYIFLFCLHATLNEARWTRPTQKLSPKYCWFQFKSISQKLHWHNKWALEEFAPELNIWKLRILQNGFDGVIRKLRCFQNNAPDFEWICTWEKPNKFFKSKSVFVFSYASIKSRNSNEINWRKKVYDETLFQIVCFVLICFSRCDRETIYWIFAICCAKSCD